MFGAFEQVVNIVESVLDQVKIGLNFPSTSIQLFLFSLKMLNDVDAV